MGPHPAGGHPSVGPHRRHQLKQRLRRGLCRVGGDLNQEDYHPHQQAGDDDHDHSPTDEACPPPGNKSPAAERCRPEPQCDPTRIGQRDAQRELDPDDDKRRNTQKKKRAWVWKSHSRYAGTVWSTRPAIRIRADRGDGFPQWKGCPGTAAALPRRCTRGQRRGADYGASRHESRLAHLRRQPRITSSCGLRRTIPVHGQNSSSHRRSQR